jgi:RNase P subunit RPR2
MSPMYRFVCLGCHQVAWHAVTLKANGLALYIHVRCYKCGKEHGFAMGFVPEGEE